MSELKALITDLDGVIVDTVPIHFKAWKKMFNEYGIDFTFEDYKHYVDGIPRIDGTKAMLKDKSSEEIEVAANKKQGYFREFLELEPIPIFDSTISLIKELKATGVKAAAISSSKNCRDILQRTNLIGLFETIVTGNDITKGKPDPQIFLMAAENLKIEPTDCIVFEDAVLGVRSAKNANMKCVGINRHDDVESLRESDLIVNDLSEISVEQIRELFR